MNDEVCKRAIDFYLLATQLKYRIRSGWDSNHWAVSSERIESVAEHIYGTCILAIAMDSEYDFGIDINKVIKMLVIHELGEVLIGDITPFDDVTIEEKRLIEEQAVREVLGNLVKKDELKALVDEFEEGLTKEAEFAYLCDKLEADIQSKIYEDGGYHKSLDEQQNNVVYKSGLIEKMRERGAKTAFDIWYEWDKDKFSNNEAFSKTLVYIKEINTKR